MKTLFVTHTTGYGGAAISLSTNLKYLLDNNFLKASECVIAAPYNKQGVLTDAYEPFNARVPFHLWQMPFSTAYKGGSTKVHAKVYSILKEIIAITFFVGAYNRIIKREEITHIHLNSMVFWSLLPFLPKSIKKIIHIRELITDNFSGKVARAVINRYADSIITISQQTAKGLPRAKIIVNPFDAYRARQYRNVRQELKSMLGLPPNSFVVSVFAPVGDQKGTGFLLKVIKETKESNVCFLIVGDPFREGKKIYNELKKTPGVFLFPVSICMDRYYAVTDIVLRCEDHLPLGRTVYEGIYAGCITVVPQADGESVSEILQYLGHQIFVYRAGDEKDCRKTFEIIKKVYPDRVYNNGFAPTTNVPKSAGKFLEVLK